LLEKQAVLKAWTIKNVFFCDQISAVLCVLAICGRRFLKTQNGLGEDEGCGSPGA
jgi:hypothetical protein